MKTKSLLTLAVLTAATTFGLTVSANTTNSTVTDVANDPIKFETTTVAPIADEPFKIENPTSTVDEPFVVQSETPTTTDVTTTTTAPAETTLPTEPSVQSQLNTTYPTIEQIRIIPFATTYVADETVAEGQEKIVQAGVDGREAITTTFINGESITDVELLQEMVPQIVHVNPNDIRVALDPSFNNAKPMPEPNVTIDPTEPFDKNVQPMPEPNVTVNPSETKSTTQTTTVVSDQPNKKVTNAETITETKVATLPETGETSNPVVMLIGLTLLLASGFTLYKKQN